MGGYKVAELYLHTPNFNTASISPLCFIPLREPTWELALLKVLARLYFKLEMTPTPVSFNRIQFWRNYTVTS